MIAPRRTGERRMKRMPPSRSRAGAADREREHQPSRHAVGERSPRDRQQRHRRELEQSDETEIERPVVDVVDLPADRDRDHLACKVHLGSSTG